MIQKTSNWAFPSSVILSVVQSGENVSSTSTWVAPVSCFTLDLRSASRVDAVFVNESQVVDVNRDFGVEYLF